jgi:trehalose-6-phosphatase
VHTDEAGHAPAAFEGCPLYPCVAISGRRRNDLAGRLRGLSPWQIFGNHGLEPWAETSQPYLPSVNGGSLRGSLAMHPGIVIEDKRYSMAVHYRRARQGPSAARDREGYSRSSERFAPRRC